jgi:poly(A) polymerase
VTPPTQPPPPPPPQPPPTQPPPAPLEAVAELQARTWLVGGAVRDRLMARPTADYDVVIDADPKPVARALARRLGAHAFELSEQFAAWRLVARDRSWQLDLLPLAGESIEQDLALRDVTVNAIAQPLPDGPAVDPFGGMADLRRRRLRAVSPEAFSRDPLRTLRLVRLACELGFAVEPGTALAARAVAPRLTEVAPERVFEELKRIVASPRVVEGFGRMDELGLTAAVLPELSALRGVDQSRYHHLDVHGHTIAVLSETVRIQEDPASVLGPHADAVARLLAAPLANGLSRWEAMRFGALLHDVAKPHTREVTPEGRVTFMGHDRLGAQTAAQVLGRLRASERLREHVALLVRNHLRLGFLVHRAPLSRRQIYGYLDACDPAGVDVTVLSIADRLATRGARSEQAIAAHLELGAQMLGEALAWEVAPPRPPVRGDQLIRELGLTSGPELGRILAELREAAFAREISSREEAIEHARALLRR